MSIKYPPYQVGSFIYSGMKSSIDRLIKLHTEGRWSDLESSQYLDLLVSMEWYTENCMAGAAHLQESLNRLAEAIGDKYFHYNLYDHHRFTIRHHLSEGIRDEYNKLLDRREYLRSVEDIKVGAIIKHDGLYLNIIEVFKDIDNMYGRFIAETLSVEYLIAIKKRGFRI